MNQSGPSVLSIGALYLDILCHNFPFGEALKPEKQVFGADYAFVPGGSAVNFARTITNLGLPTTLVGKTGTDAPAHSLSELLEPTGVELIAIASPDVQTNISMNFNGPEGNTLFASVGTANQSMEPDEILPIASKHLPDASYLYLGGCLKLTNLLPALHSLAHEAKARNVTVVVDHGRVFDTLSDESRTLVKGLCEVADIYLPSVDELMALWDAGSIDEAVRRLREVSATTVVVKDGPKGAVAFTESETLRCAAYDVAVGNPVGAGDGLNAGFIRAHSRGMSTEESLDFGCATAALKISRQDLPNEASVIELMSRR